MRLEGKHIVVTGGGSGIGRALVLALLARGARVTAVDRSAEGMQQTAQIARSDQLHLVTADVTDQTGCAALPARIAAEAGPVDGLINNAGVVQPFEDFADLDMAVIDRVLSVNLMGTVVMTKAFLPALLARPEAHLVNLSSMGGFLPYPGQSIYSASKAAVKGLTEALSQETQGTGLRVSCVMPGAVATGIMENSGVDAPGSAAKGTRPPLLPAEAAARIILSGVERDRLHILVGRDARRMFALSRLAPVWTIGRIQRQIAKMRG